MGISSTKGFCVHCEIVVNYAAPCFKCKLPTIEMGKRFRFPKHAKRKDREYVARILFRMLDYRFSMMSNHSLQHEQIKSALAYIERHLDTDSEDSFSLDVLNKKHMKYLKRREIQKERESESEKLKTIATYFGTEDYIWDKDLGTFDIMPAPLKQFLRKKSIPTTEIHNKFREGEEYFYVAGNFWLHEKYYSFSYFDENIFSDFFAVKKAIYFHKSGKFVSPNLGLYNGHKIAAPIEFESDGNVFVFKNSEDASVFSYELSKIFLNYYEDRDISEKTISLMYKSAEQCAKRYTKKTIEDLYPELAI